jgi:hypothetical protein
VFENRVLWRIFGPKRDEVTGCWRKLHNEDLCRIMGEMRNAERIVVGKPEGKRPLGRPRHKWEDNIKIDIRKVGLRVCIGLI